LLHARIAALSGPDSPESQNEQNVILLKSRVHAPQVWLEAVLSTGLVLKVGKLLLTGKSQKDTQIRK